MIELAKTYKMHIEFVDFEQGKCYDVDCEIFHVAGLLQPGRE
jgi:hypothetical protein